MSEEKAFQMDFGKIYGLLLNKAVKKGRTKAEVDHVISWLTGYDEKEIEDSRAAAVYYGGFFLKAPQPNPARLLVTSAICGVRVEEIKNPIMRDKLTDELAKGRPIEKILRK